MRRRHRITVNTSFAQLVGSSSENLVGTRLENYVPDENVRAKLFAGADQPVEADLRHVDGTLIPVELILRSSILAAARIMPLPFAISGPQAGRATHPLSRAP